MPFPVKLLRNLLSCGLATGRIRSSSSVCIVRCGLRLGVHDAYSLSAGTSLSSRHLALFHFRPLISKFESPCCTTTFSKAIDHQITLLKTDS